MQDVEEREYQVDNYLSDIASGNLISATIRIPSDELQKIAKAHPNLMFTIERTYIDNGHDINITSITKKNI